MSKVVTGIICSNIGVSTITGVHVRPTEKGFEARVGVSMMGGVNSEKSVGADPFAEDFYDNFANGVGATEEEAVAAMREDMTALADSLWAE